MSRWERLSPLAGVEPFTLDASEAKAVFPLVPFDKR